MEDDEEELDFVLDELDNLLLFCRPITVVWRKRENKFHIQHVAAKKDVTCESTFTTEVHHCLCVPLCTITVEFVLHTLNDTHECKHSNIQTFKHLTRCIHMLNDTHDDTRNTRITPYQQ